MGAARLCVEQLVDVVAFLRVPCEHDSFNGGFGVDRFYGLDVYPCIRLCISLVHVGRCWRLLWAGTDPLAPPRARHAVLSCLDFFAIALTNVRLERSSRNRWKSGTNAGQSRVDDATGRDRTRGPEHRSPLAA